MEPRVNPTPNLRPIFDVVPPPPPKPVVPVMVAPHPPPPKPPQEANFNPIAGNGSIIQAVEVNEDTEDHELDRILKNVKKEGVEVPDGKKPAGHFKLGRHKPRPSPNLEPHIKAGAIKPPPPKKPYLAISAALVIAAVLCTAAVVAFRSS